MPERISIMKKKILALLAAMILCLSLAACGGPSPEEDLVGTWTVDMGYGMSADYTFSAEGKVDTDIKYNGESQTATHGTYVVGEESVTITWDSGSVVDFPFYYEEDNLIVQSSAGEDFILEKK